MEFYDLDFYGLRRKLPITHISKTKKIANFNILGDVEFTEKAGELLEKELTQKNIKPDCFVGPEVKVVPFIHNMAKRFGHRRYIVLRKTIRGYMSSPTVEEPSDGTPKHVKKLVLSGPDKEFLIGKKVVLIDDVISTGATMKLLARLMEKVGVTVLAKCSIFKQGDGVDDNLLYLAKLPIFEVA